MFGDRVGGLAFVAWAEVSVVSSVVSFATGGDIFAVEVAAIGIFAIVESPRSQVFVCVINVSRYFRCSVEGWGQLFCCRALRLDALEYAG